MKPLKLCLLRHGECAGGNILRGRIDVELSAIGQMQMDAAIARLAYKPAYIVSSSLSRCFKWSQAVASQRQIHLTKADWLQEMDFGDWDGKTFDELYQQDAQAMTLFWQNPWQHHSPNGETMAAFSARVLTGLQATLSHCLSASVSKESHDQSVLLVTHGGVIKCLLAYFLGAGQSAKCFSQLNIPYGALIEIDVFYTATEALPEPPLKSELALKSEQEQNISGIEQQLALLNNMQFMVQWPNANRF